MKMNVKTFILRSLKVTFYCFFMPFILTYGSFNTNTTHLFFIFSLSLFPQAGPDIKYFLGFVRTQLSTTTTIILVFGPKILRVLRGQGDKWDHRSRARGITASFCINGGGLMPEEGIDLYQENEELKVIRVYLHFPL